MSRMTPDGGRGSRPLGSGAGASLLAAREGDGVPKYIQLAAIIKDKILRQEYRANQQVPTEEQLCQEYQVSRITVREAVNRRPRVPWKANSAQVRRDSPAVLLARSTRTKASVICGSSCVPRQRASSARHCS